MITKKTFIKIAATVAEEKKPETRFKWACLMADLFAEDNPRFDRERFMKACNANHPLS